MSYFRVLSLTCVLCVSLTLALCNNPLPAFPLPSYTPQALAVIFESIEEAVKHAVSSDQYANSSFSIEVTSSQGTLWSSFHTAKQRNASRLGAPVVNADSVYRIASITKTFTTLAILQQQAAGNLSLDDSISQYIAELNGPQNGTIPWKDITLRTLASQLAGIPREFAQSDLRNYLPDPTTIGLPPTSERGLIQCNEYGDYEPCGRKEFLDYIKTKRPLFAPKQKSTYSNVAFNLLGLAIENVTGLSYSKYIETAILEPLRMNSTSLDKPHDSVAVIPNGENYWDVEEGIQRPTGGIYASSADMSTYLRYILTHYNGLTPALNWFHPASYSTGSNSFYGVPWEIFRTEKMLPDTRKPVTFVTKSGGLPGYFSIIIMAPEYDLGIVLLVAGENSLLEKLRELVTVPLIRGAEHLAWAQVHNKYTGTYTSPTPSLNSSLTITSNPLHGLAISSFISNSTDVFDSLRFGFGADLTSKGPWHAQLIPTLLFRDEESGSGEVWRVLVVSDPGEEEEGGNQEGETEVWQDFCITDDDPISYAGVPLNEFVFWGDEDGVVGEVEAAAFRVKLVKQSRPVVVEEGVRGVVWQG